MVMRVHGKSLKAFLDKFDTFYEENHKEVFELEGTDFSYSESMVDVIHSYKELKGKITNDRR